MKTAKGIKPPAKASVSVKTKLKKGTPAEPHEHADFFFGMLAMLLLIVVLLLIMPSGCACRANPSTAIVAPPPPAATSTPPVQTAWLSPTSGPVGTVVTIYGAGFDGNNTILMNGDVSGGMKNVTSPDGKTLAFTVPANLGPNCAPKEACPQFLMLVTPNTYKVSVITNDVSQDIGSFTVTGSNTLP